MTDTAEYLEELAQTLASHGSNLAALRMAELEQKVSPYLAAPGVPTRQVGSDVVANSLGNVEPFIEKMNLLQDPTFETMYQTVTPAAGEASASSYSTWYTRAVSGSYPATYPKFFREYARENDDNPFNSDEVAYDTGVVTGSGTYEARLRSSYTAGGTRAVHPYLVGAVRLNNVYADLGANTNVTSKTATIEVYNVSDWAVKATRTVDLYSVCPNTSENRSFRLWVAYLLTAGEEYDAFGLRISLTMVTTGAGGELTIYLGEPQLHRAYSPDPVPYAPVLGRWSPQYVIGHHDNFALVAYPNDSLSPRFSVDLAGATKWGSGAADVDTRLRRSGTKTLTIDDTAAGAATLNVVGAIQNGGTRVVGSRKGGWGVPTGTAERAAFDTASVTTAQLAQRVKALIDDLWLHGLIGGADAGHASATGAAYSPTVVIT